jgi:DNA-binding LacI/PurR family transcriptional regulator/signal transduction histidine kinase
MLSSRLDDLYELQWLGAADAAAAHGVDFVSFVGGELASADGYRSQANAIYDLAGADRLDGLIVWTTALEMFVGSRAMDEFCRRFDPLPIVSVERVLAGSPSVLMDERRGMDDAVSHLIEAHSCERIAFIRGPANHTGAEHRYQGYRDALARHGLRPDPALAPAVSAWAPEPAAVAATKLLTDRSAPVDAFVTANDDLALGVLGALDAQHVRVPHDVAVVGFDDHINLTYHGVGMMLSNLGGERAISLTAALVPLTTVRAPFYQLGWRAVELLLERLSGVAVPGVVTIPTELVVRRSCGCFPSAVRDVVTRPVDRERFSDTGWEQAANEMRHALPRSNAALPTDWPERLEAAFVKDVETDSAAAFLELLDELMQASIAAGDTLDNWSRALSALRRHTASAHALADTSPAVEDFWLRVHSLVRELVARLTDYEHLDTARRDRIVRGAGRRLNAAHDAEELTEVLVDELPKLGIPSCYLAMYGSEGEREEAERQGDERAWSRTLLVYEAGRMRKLRAGRRSFRSRELAPMARLGSATPSGMVAMPLYFQERQLGFALFEVGPRLGWVYGDLQEQLSSALHSALLIEREHRALAALKQAHGELEQRVALRTAELATANEALARLAEEQAALRRVATLVARQSSPEEVLRAVAEEVAELLGTDGVGIFRFEPDGTATQVAQSDTPWEPVPLGTRFPLEGESVVASVLRTGKTARLDDGANASGRVAERARSLGIRCSVATPIVVAGRLWGTMVAVTAQIEPLPADTESRLTEFTQLVATAISNAQVRTELAASRARLAAAADDERRRVVRDLHDGAQQRLVHAVITMKLARRALDSGDDARPLLAEALAQAEEANVELRELVHGILPAVLASGGLRAVVEALASRTPVAIDTAVSVGRFPAAIEATAYFVVAEALTNVAKHARAKRAQVSAHVEEGGLRVEVRDDGVGGARSDGSGLVGLGDRIAALDGRFQVESPAGGGTLVTAYIPLPE